jgi:hypothetical protein
VVVVDKGTAVEELLTLDKDDRPVEESSADAALINTKK